ncbi:MAG: hypothetical protein MHM6MM_006470 [Cercozoa sp. M6MM]
MRPAKRTRSSAAPTVSRDEALLQRVHMLQREEQQEEQSDSVQARKASLIPLQAFATKTGSAAADDEGDDSDIEQAGDDIEVELDEAQEEALNMFMPAARAERRSLAAFMDDQMRQSSAGQTLPGDEAPLPEKVVRIYTEIGAQLAHYKSGRFPKAFSLVPSIRNWERLLALTQPERWTTNAVAKATRIFVSNGTTAVATKFCNLVLLERCRDDILKHRRLNYHLYVSLKKALFKPRAFIQGVLIPLVQTECTAREAVIFGSVLAKMSVPVAHSAVALTILAQEPYSGPLTIFLKVFIEKKYRLPMRVIEALLKWFCSFASDKRKLPVLWHQALLSFVTLYSQALNEQHRAEIVKLLRQQKHHHITPAIRALL